MLLMFSSLLERMKRNVYLMMVQMEMGEKPSEDLN